MINTLFIKMASWSSFGKVHAIDHAGDKGQAHGDRPGEPRALVVVAGGAAAPLLGALVDVAGLVVLVKLANQVVLEHLPGVGRVSDVLEGLGGVGAGVLKKDLLSTGMLKKRRVIHAWFLI